MIDPSHAPWRLRMGANVTSGGVEFRVWAPAANTIDVTLGQEYIPLTRGNDDVWSGVIPGTGAGTRYRYRVDGVWSFPDPYSRSQPDGPHEPSCVIDPSTYTWNDASWRGVGIEGLTVYECHVGAYTPQGTFDALAADLPALRDLGIGAIELMPVADFPGQHNWGYDGVDMFAPSRNYGGPEGLKRLVDAAHEQGIAVILDVVYNHFGPDGNYLLQYSPDYLTDRYGTAWGDAVNYDGEHSQWVRRFAIDNACYWLNEYHIDGLRVDATFSIFDQSPRHILEEIVTTARASIAPRTAVFIAETYENDVRYLHAPSEGGHGFDAAWADDFHHVVHTISSREHSGYYVDYAGTVEELARTIEHGWLFEGQHSKHLGTLRGTSGADLPAHSFVYFIENHDQVGNRAFGRRFSHLVGASVKKFWSSLLLLLPYTPMIFMGQEFAASSRFYYFTDHKDELGRQVTEGRRRDIAALDASADVEGNREIPDPQALETFLKSKLNLDERNEGVGAQMWLLHRELLALRKRDSVLARQDRSHMRVLAANNHLLLVHSWHSGDERLIVANFGVAIDATPASINVPPELASKTWRTVISTEERRFGGSDDRVRFDAALISLPPYTVAWLAAQRESLTTRAVSTVRRLINNLRRRK